MCVVGFLGVCSLSFHDGMYRIDDDSDLHPFGDVGAGSPTFVWEGFSFVVVHLFMMVCIG